jgi:hypothetical protein
MQWMPYTCIGKYIHTLSRLYSLIFRITFFFFNIPLLVNTMGFMNNYDLVIYCHITLSLTK